MLFGSCVSVQISWRRWPWRWGLKNWVGITRQKIGKDISTPSELSCETKMWSWHSFAPKIPMNPHYLNFLKTQILRTHHFKYFINICLSMWSFSSVLEGRFYAQKRLLVILLDFQLIFDVLWIQLNFSLIFYIQLRNLIILLTM